MAPNASMVGDKKWQLVAWMGSCDDLDRKMPIGPGVASAAEHFSDFSKWKGWVKKLARLLLCPDQANCLQHLRSNK